MHQPDKQSFSRVLFEALTSAGLVVAIVFLPWALTRGTRLDFENFDQKPILVMYILLAAVSLIAIGSALPALSGEKQQGSLLLRFLHKMKNAMAKAGLHALSRSGFYDDYWQHWRGELFEVAERSGFHILPVHYYSPIPTNADLRRPRRKNRMNGVALDIPAAILKASDLINKYRPEIDAVIGGVGGYDSSNGAFYPLDAALLFAIIREERPRRIIEIGSGSSTLVMLSAIKDGGSQTKLTCIEPYLPSYLDPHRPQISTLLEKPLQEVPIEIFSELESGDILFIDSTHVVRFDSDVVFEILDILPILKPGVIVHVHDIFLPEDYPQEWLAQHRFFWNEQYMLQAFLSMNPHFKIEVPVSAIKYMLNLDGPLLPKSEIEVTSLWMRRTG